MDLPRRRPGGLRRSRRPLTRALALLALALLAAGGVSLAAGAAGAPLAAGAPVTAAPAPDLPPLPAPLAARMAELSRTVEGLRGLRFKEAVRSGALTQAELRLWIEREAAKQPPEVTARLGAALLAFGFIPPGFDVVRFLPDLLTEQIGGFYDPDRKVMVLIRDAAGRALGEAGSLGEAGGEKGPLEEALLVHELTHALDDQVFGLPTEEDAEEATGFLSDRDAARRALDEGDATLVMLDHLTGQRLEELGGLLAGFADPANLGAVLPSGEAGGVLAQAPAFFRETLLFSYFQGLTFCAEVRRAGGQRLLDHAFAKDPPRSTEQILHPEKWHGRRDDPVALVWPDLATELRGWVLASAGEMGELDIRFLLKTAPGGEQGASAAAAGWGGDRFAVYRKEGKSLLLWLTEWDGEADAEEFAAAARRLTGGWTVERLASTRVALLRGDVPAAARPALLARLAAAKAERPANPAGEKP